MNLQGFQGLTPAQQLLQQQQQQKQQQQQQQQNLGTQLQFNDLFPALSNINSINSSNNNANSAGNGQNNQNVLGQQQDGFSASQSLAQTLFQGQYRSHTPQQRSIQPQLSQQQQQQQQQQQAHRVIQLDPPSLAMSSHWQDQVQLAEVSRKSTNPHSYARNAATASRRSKQQSQFLENNVSGNNNGKAYSLVEMTKQLLEQDHPTISTTTNHSSGSQNSSETDPTGTNNTPSALLHNKKTSHDINDNDDDIDDFTVPRITSKKFPEQLWGGLDLSGQRISNLSSNLFKYEFLTKLYLNGNKLTEVPKAIKNLKYLKILDLSNNALTSLPSELGLLCNLKYLYLFDNNLTNLPDEFGNLFDLSFLGIEGNPNFNEEFAKILAERGTRSLIVHLRDNVANQTPPPKRQWIVLKDEDEEEVDEEEEKESFTALSFNVLCQHYATTKLYSYTPSWALNWEYRREVIKQQILESDADIICLQEVETQSFEDYWLRLMTEKGYRGIFHAKYRARRMNERDAKKVDGCATFYKYSKFTLAEKKSLEYTQIVLNSQKYKKSDDVFNRLQSRDNIGLVTILTHIETGQNVLLANTHLHWDPAFNDVKTVQVGVLLEEIEVIAKKLLKSNENSNLKNLPVLICGDFNSQLHSAVYKLFANGFVKEHEDIDGRDYGKFTEVGFSHPFHLRSAYDNIGELPFTNFTPSFTDVLDYIWYTPSNLSVRGLLGKIDPDYLSHYVGFPNAHFPSDHLPLIAKFHIKQTKKESSRRDFKPEFRSSRKT